MHMRMAALLVDAFVLLVGVGAMLGSINSGWALENAASKAAGLVGGGFLCILGVVLIGAALDVLEDLGEILQGIWDDFLGAIGR